MDTLIIVFMTHGDTFMIVYGTRGYVDVVYGTLGTVYNSNAVRL